MPDIFTPEERSLAMSRIRSKNTKIEIRVRKAMHAFGFRYQLHKNLPGRPDIFLARYNAAIFVNGCFWHGHDCSLFKIPSTRTEFWLAKISTNQKRDQKVIQLLEKEGIRVAIVWECALRGKGLDKFTFLISQLANWVKDGNNYATFSKVWLVENYQNISSR